MPSMSLADRFQAVTAHAKTEEHQKKSYEELSKTPRPLRSERPGWDKRSKK
jgi:hypothetical protein